MIKRISCFAAGLILLLNGCIFGGSSKAVRTFDLIRPEAAGAMLPCRIDFALFRNLSGSDRRFLTRHPDGQMTADEFSRWMLDPELMLERYFRDQLRGSGKNLIRIRGVVTAFEINARDCTAELAVDFTLYCGGTSRRFFCAKREKLSGEKDDDEAAAEAMSRCAAETAKALRADILSFIKEKQNSGDF